MTLIAQLWLALVMTALGLPLGAAALLMIHRLTGGLWGEEAGPALRRIAAWLPWTLLAMLPLLAAIGLLLPFLGADPATLPERVAGKLGYLQPVLIIARTIVVAGFWLAAAILGPRSRASAAAGLIAYMLGLTIFTTDWMQALDPAFYSTIYPVEVAGAQLLGALALATMLTPVDARGDFGRLLLTCVLSWAYFAAMQWLIVWMGDLPDEAEWYLRRMAGGWPLLLLVAVSGLVIVPFFALLPKTVRDSLPRVQAIAAIIVVGYFAESLWRMGPAHG